MKSYMNQKSKLPTALLAVCVTLLTSLSLGAQEVRGSNIAVSGAYSKATVAGQMASSGFMKITSTGISDQLVGVSSQVAGEVQLHSMSMEGNTMKMRQINSIDIPANSTVELTPGGLHLMFMGLKTQLKVGDTVKIKLKFASSGEIEVNLPVQAVSPDQSMHNHMMK
jgi:hypothetical protein